jgi:predicted glycosyltransferase
MGHLRMAARRTNRRILIYSHDTLGLGHLRRCRAIAHALVERNSDLSVMILSGSPIIGSFDFRSRVDFVRVPGVIKLRNGEYTSLNLHIDIEETLALRASIIKHTADIFDPDLFLVDKEPLGLRGEVKDTLTMLKARGTPLVLGLRDVLDEPNLLVPEWERKNVVPALRDLYDAIWVYGLPELHDPLSGITLPQSVHRKVFYTGYLRRTAPQLTSAVATRFALGDEPYLLVTSGGGGDGEALTDWVLRAYEADKDLPWRALIVTGPFMQPEFQAEFLKRASRLRKVEAITFDAHMESLMANAAGVVAMGGYNTLCEILSFDKRALIVPRTTPRLEQFIRAQRFQDVGLSAMLADDGVRDAKVMAKALRRLPKQKPPSASAPSGLLDGLDVVNRLTLDELGRPTRPRLKVARQRAVAAAFRAPTL